MAVSAAAIDAELLQVKESLSSSWEDLAGYAKAKLMECAINGGVTSYAVNGRSVTKDAQFFERILKLAKAEAALEAAPGGIARVAARFVDEPSA